MECMVIWGWFQHSESDEFDLPHLIAAGISIISQCAELFILKVLFWIHQSVATFAFHSCSLGFACGFIICDVLISWSCCWLAAGNPLLAFCLNRDQPALSPRISQFNHPPLFFLLKQGSSCKHQPALSPWVSGLNLPLLFFHNHAGNCHLLFMMVEEGETVGFLFCFHWVSIASQGMSLLNLKCNHYFSICFSSSLNEQKYLHGVFKKWRYVRISLGFHTEIKVTFAQNCFF